MTENITITPASPRDLTRILALIRDLSAFHGDEAAVTLEQLQQIFFGDQAQGKAFVARAGQEVVGYAGIMRWTVIHSGKPRLDIQHLYIAENRRNRGIGKALIMAARDYAIASGAKGISIGTDPRNASAQAAYRAMGLEELTDIGPRFWIAAEV
ncbi:GNAT family N-acetyltransferase [Yoonia litorea]|uniref:Ribosomal protein S18 acetylase RimI n=1 Tax=Yoonia litorea TaxID=1123755 RepID=A0A1I6LFR0_9RHOB|nr:GNAT family N-acetyltransferase [Yoonia litorea]SFS02304.1 Ribosomal protein S18 acetylase RimI [Yoonia litorea]